jgi:hypothetical protein
MWLLFLLVEHLKLGHLTHDTSGAMSAVTNVPLGNCETHRYVAYTGRNENLSHFL